MWGVFSGVSRESQWESKTNGTSLPVHGEVGLVF